MQLPKSPKRAPDMTWKVISITREGGEDDELMESAVNQTVIKKP
jgi:hypothetical protein